MLRILMTKVLLAVFFVVSCEGDDHKQEVCTQEGRQSFGLQIFDADEKDVSSAATITVKHEEYEKTGSYPDVVPINLGGDFNVQIEHNAHEKKEVSFTVETDKCEHPIFQLIEVRLVRS